MTRCDFRTNRECHCAPGECATQPKAIAIRRAPTICLTVGEQLFIMTCLILIAIPLGYLALARVDHVIKVQDLENQESSINVSRR